MRFNVLTGTVKRTLKEVGLAIKGLSVMSAELEALGNSMVLGRVPDLWKAVASRRNSPDSSKKGSGRQVWCRQGWYSSFRKS
jgi:dynein heavy chain